MYSGCYTVTREKRSAVVFNITKGHFLSNENKRIAMILVAYFLGFEGLISGYSEIDNKKIEPLAMNVTCGSISKEELLPAIPKRTFKLIFVYEKKKGPISK